MALGGGHSEAAAKRATRRATHLARKAGRRSPPKHHETPTSARSSQLHPERRALLRSGAPRPRRAARRRFAACHRPWIHEKRGRTKIDLRWICARRASPALHAMRFLGRRKIQKVEDTPCRRAQGRAGHPGQPAGAPGPACGLGTRRGRQATGHARTAPPSSEDLSRHERGALDDEASGHVMTQRTMHWVCINAPHLRCAVGHPRIGS